MYRHNALRFLSTTTSIFVVIWQWLIFFHYKHYFAFDAITCVLMLTTFICKSSIILYYSKCALLDKLKYEDRNDFKLTDYISILHVAINMIFTIKEIGEVYVFTDTMFAVFVPYATLNAIWYASLGRATLCFVVNSDKK